VVHGEQHAKRALEIAAAGGHVLTSGDITARSPLHLGGIII